jgi:hypothetical protein
MAAATSPPTGSEAVDPAAEPDASAQTPPAPAPRVLFGELTSSLGGLGLLVLLFAAKWYGVAGVPDPSAVRPAVSGTETGWTGLSLVRWVVLVTALAALGSLLLHASQRRHGAKTDTSWLICGLGTLTSLLLVYRVLLVLPSPDRVIDQKLGGVVALACALAVAVGGHESIAEQRLRARIVVQRTRRRPGLASRRGNR